MSTFQRYKEVMSGNVNNGRLSRIERHKQLRKSRRTMAFNKNRSITNSPINIDKKEGQPARVVEDRLTRLQKWRAEREKHKKMEKVKKKPFVVGVVHHKLYSPLTSIKSVTRNTKSSKCYVTRATQKRLLQKELTKKAKTESSATSRTLTKNQSNQKEHKECFAPKGHKFKAPAGLSHIPLFGRVAIQSMSPARLSEVLCFSPRISRTYKTSTSKLDAKQIEDKKDNILITNNKSNCDTAKANPLELGSLRASVLLSPLLGTTHGKYNSRNKQIRRCNFSVDRTSDDEIPTKDTVMNNLNTSIEEEEHIAQYFQFLLNNETTRLNELCKKWTKIKVEPETVEEGQYEINQAIGQTNLLISKKFKRFRGLVEDCKTGKGEMVVTCKDLQGFWDMMYMDIKDCNSRFERLEKLRSQGWEEQKSPVSKPLTRRKTNVKKKTVSTKPSLLRTFLKERGKGMKNNVDAKDSEPNQNEMSNIKHKKNRSPNVTYKTRRSSTIDLHENKLTPVKHDKRLSLVKKLQCPETSKDIQTPLTMLKISQRCKTPQVLVTDIASNVNSDQTSRKCILKSQESTTTAKIHAKSTNNVNFANSAALNDVPIDEKNKIQMDLIVALTKIDSLDFNSTDRVTINAAKKLVFSDNLEESEDDTKQDINNKNFAEKTVSRIPFERLEITTSLQELKKNFNISPQRRSLRRQNAIDDSNESIRILRNRTVTSTDTPKVTRRSSRKISMNIQQSEYKENKTPSEKRNTRHFSKFSVSKNEKMAAYNNTDDTRLEENSNRERSTRNVKFAEKECSVCVTDKETLPTTPYVRRSRALSKEKKRRNTITKNLISWETPEKISE